MISFKTQVNEKIMEHCSYKQILGFFSTLSVIFYAPKQLFESISWIYFMY